MDISDLQQDSGRYLQEYIQSLENLPSEINYHWAEIQNREEQGKNLERRVHTQQHDLTKLHRQWFHQELEKREKILKHEPNIIKRVQRDYDKLEDLASERIQLAENALRLVDRHLERLGHDLDLLDKLNPEFQAPQTPSIMDIRRNGVEELEEEEEEEEEDDEEAYFAAMMANRQKKRKKKEARDGEEHAEEPLYCYCRQVSYGEMVGCDGEHCPYEWFHMECTGLDAPPKGAWYCDECQSEAGNARKLKKMKRKKESMGIV
ncbi:uncharacterized protein BX664DRAFT_354522 [Halteromyces radiatus]|uniref:uncharacterized protein n=1 Tax=Halteromyces radiatus TaxID=101107 RepID=UPI00221EB118|nr:uncharacterized protein BX664DRAFT_354522 [Halteromyces radiatus]KAI8099041.1 hypothetical protein BX664DRAFT_354522 [Halteromyces radiatus]